ncbi:MAG: hypothetical protein ABI416_11270 [Ginsengibacter sp.]
MIYYKKYWIFLISMVFYCRGFAQVFGGDPPCMQWKQINSPLVRVIFPAGMDSTAGRIANVISFINARTLQTIGTKSKKVNLVLQNQTTVSNAYVGLGPFRSEFLTTPFQNSFELGSLPWQDQLTIHEYRHVQQYNNFNTGLSKIFYAVFGDEGQALANNASIPNWFFEGDAVFNETNISMQGRGRLPFFYNGYRALWKAGRQYNWMKLRNGSYKDFVPDHYALGFLLVTYGREKYGDKFWEKVTHDAAAFKGLIYPFQRAIKKYSGQDYVTFRKEALNFFQVKFARDTSAAKEGEKKKVFTNDEYPSFNGNDTVVFMRSGYKEIPRFIIRTTQAEKRLRVRDYSPDMQFSVGNGKIVYAAYVPDKRWGYRDYSDLRIINIANGTQQTLTRHTKYFSPALSEDGQKIVAVDVRGDTKSSLHILDASTGRLTKVLPNPEHLFYTYPKFYGDQNIIAAVRNDAGKMSLAVVDAGNGGTEYITPFSYDVIGFPYLLNDTVYFSRSYLEKDELFAYTFSDKKLWHIIYKTGKGIGRYQLSVNNDKLIWSTFTAAGYQLQEAAKNELQFEEIRPKDLDKNISGMGITELTKTTSNLLIDIPNDSFAATKYHKASRPFNFHSIEPAADDPEYTLTLHGENILNTFQSQLAFTYNRAEKFKKAGFNMVYGGLFPFLSAGVNYTIDRRAFYHGNAFAFNELEPYAGFNIPLNLSKGRSFSSLNFGSQYIYNQSNFKGVYKDSLGRISYGYSSSFLSFTHQSQTARQQIFPQFAQTITITYKAAVSQYKGSQLVVNGRLYVPGFLTTHSILLNGAYLRKDSSGQINFSSAFPFSRGYNSINLYEMYKWGIDYHFPIVYPDAGFGNILYLLRIRANLFYDDTEAKDFNSNRNKFSASFRSAGAEITFDTKLWNEANASLGIRFSHLFDNNLFGNGEKNRWEIILPLNIFNQ